MVVVGSMSYSPNGRKRAVYRKRHKAIKGDPAPASSPYRRETPNYPSAEDTGSFTGKIDSPLLTKTLTIAPAYNKGAYQVISEENIKDIGR